MNTRELANTLDQILAPAGFRRRNDTWYKTNEDTITLVDLQKSQWGGQYYVNLGVYLRVLGRTTSPPEHLAHIRARLGSIAGDDASAIEEALDLERSSISAEQRASTIAKFLRTLALPYLAERSALPRLRRLHAEGRLGPAMVLKSARDVLEASAQ
jgi:hypothetical protein